MQSSATIKELATALAKAQAEMKNPTFDSTNPHFRNKFASLSAVREAVTPILAKHGISITQFPKTGEGVAGCVSRLMHASGEWIEEECLLPLDKNNAQGAGSCITYARRYSLQGIAGVVAEEDDDANAASAPGKPAPHKPVTVDVWDSLSDDAKKWLQEIADSVRAELDAKGGAAALKVLEEQGLDADHKVAIWSRFDSKERAAMKPPVQRKAA
jgi:hypothetical protein